MAPNKSNRCWICGRSSDEVSSSVGRPPEELELDTRLGRTEDLMGKFSKASGEWGNLVPEQFRALGFDFVVGNPAQFKSIRFLGEVDDAKKSTVIPLQVAVTNVRNGAEATIGGVKIGPADLSKREVLLREIDQFERRMGRYINGSGENGSMSHGSEGLDMVQGLAFLREIGLLYFTVQEKLLEAESEEEMSRRPVFAVSIAKVGGLPGDVPVCTVCQNLVTSLVPA